MQSAENLEHLRDLVTQLSRELIVIRLYVLFTPRVSAGTESIKKQLFKAFLARAKRGIERATEVQLQYSP